MHWATEAGGQRCEHFMIQTVIIRLIHSQERVLLFVKMHNGHAFTSQISAQIKAQIGASLSKRHVPAYIFETPEIPVSSSYFLEMIWRDPLWPVLTSTYRLQSMLRRWKRL